VTWSGLCTAPRPRPTLGARGPGVDQVVALVALVADAACTNRRLFAARGANCAAASLLEALAEQRLRGGQRTAVVHWGCTEGVGCTGERRLGQEQVAAAASFALRELLTLPLVALLKRSALSVADIGEWEPAGAALFARPDAPLLQELHESTEQQEQTQQQQQHPLLGRRTPAADVAIGARASWEGRLGSRMRGAASFLAQRYGACRSPVLHADSCPLPRATPTALLRLTSSPLSPARGVAQTPWAVLLEMMLGAAVHYMMLSTCHVSRLQPYTD